MRGLAALMIAAVICHFGRAAGSPGDIFATPAPTLGSDPPKATDVKDGDMSVSSQTGAVQYSYPIAVPPGRQGMAPQLALSYSSQAPLYGSGFGAGWTLSIPRIEEDTSRGRLRTHSPGIEASQSFTARKADDRFTSSLAGGRALVPVSTDPVAANVYQNYRAQADASFARYQRMNETQPFRWRVLMTDGSVMYFGDSDRTQGCPISDGYAPLTRHVDAFGNEVSYQYVNSFGECMLNRISWGQNANAGLGEIAEVVVHFGRGNFCNGVHAGSQLSFRSGVAILSGANRVNSIEIAALDASAPNGKAHTRTISFGYSEQDESCSGIAGAPKKHSPVRILTSIQESAVGVDMPAVTLPPVTFGYGPSSVELTTVTTTGTPWGESDTERPIQNFGWGFRRDDDRWPSVEAMMLDIDGDGLPDRVHNAWETAGGVTSCKATWQRNDPSNNPVTGHFENPRLLTFGDSGSTRMPMLRWQGQNDGDPNGSQQAFAADPQLEGCALNGQVTAFHNSHATPGVCHDNTTACTIGSYCPDGNACPDFTEPGPRTYLAYRWLDMDGDGLADLVAAVHGNANRYDIVRGNNLINGVQLGYEPALFGTVPIPSGLPPCTDLPDRCKRLGSDCMNRIDTNVCEGSSVCSYDWADINACVSQAPDEECHMEIALLAAGQDQGNTPEDPGDAASPRTPYRMCNNLYPWFIFKNRGNGNFSDTPIIKYQPVPLESDSGDSSLTGPGIAASNHGVLDVDGDGLVDGIVRARDADWFSHSWWWYVWLNDGTGGLGPTRYVWPSRVHAMGAISGIDSNVVDVTGSSMGLFDINGDGLVDHWHANPDPTPPLLATGNVAYNDGTGFRTLHGALPPTAGELTTNTTKPGSDSHNHNLVTENANGHTNIITGYRYAHLRPFDVDADGRPDMLIKNSLGAYPSVAFNLGGNFNGGALWEVTEYGASQDMSATEIFSLPEHRVWQVYTDLTDLDDDGLPESRYWLNGLMTEERHDVATNGPPRLLRTVNNGQGAITTITYASMHDKSQTDPVVEQNPDEMWAPGRPKASPRNQWVVQSLGVQDLFAGTTSTTTYRYKNPRFNADDDGQYGFRGFEEVRTTSPSGMKTIARYSFDPDWSGRLATRLIVPGEDLTKVRSIDKTTWTAKTLSGTAVTTYHATVTEHFTCANDHTEATCTATWAPAYTRTETTLEEFPLSGSKLLWLETGSLLKKQIANADGDRESTSTFELLVDGTTYRVRPRATTRRHRAGGVMGMFAKTDQTWDATLRAKLTDEVWVDTDDTQRAITSFLTDMTTGNVTDRWKPVQNAAGTTKTSFTFDAKKLFAIGEVNEKGHPFDYTFEYGTGTKLVTIGPNQRTCTTQPNCLSDPLHPVRETKKIRVDGLGRTIERWETTSDDGYLYTLRQFEKATYSEGNGSTVPVSTLVETALDLNATQWKQEKTEVDGHGRPIEKTLFAQGSAPADHVTTFAYRNDGTLQYVSLPDPTANNASLVTYTYGFDSLGRATSIRRPDASWVPDQSGANIAYDGVTKTVTEVVGAALGQVAVTKTVNDAFGRLVQVHEQLASTPATWAITNYSYGPDDLVSLVVDPQSVTTSLTHDFAGHRTQITRHGRTWKYGYDKNGNMVSEQVPGSPNPPLTDPDYTTTTAYDDLDRPASRVVASRGLSTADRELFVSGTETFTWDLGANHIGYIRYWSAFAPNAITPAIRQELFNDNQGRRTITQHHLTIAGYPELGRAFRQSFRPFGGVATTLYNDAVGGTAESNSTVQYDLRGLPSSINLVRGGLPSPDNQIQVAAFTRNVGGLVTKRRANTTGPMTFIESNWTYDKLGRVTSQVVQKGPGPVQVARQDLTYFGNDDPKTLDHAMGTDNKHFAYGYDRRHQLVSANETTSPGYFTSTYSYGTAGRFTAANLLQSTPAPGSELKSRTVDYQYADADPERVTALINSPGSPLAGLPYATYTYDEAGNQRTRCYGTVTTPTCAGESVEFVYDGHDQLRRATKKNNGTVVGSEEYWYGTDNQRVAVVKRDAAGLKTEMVWFIGDAEAHYDGDGALTHVYSHVSMGSSIARVARSSNSAAPLEFQFHALAASTLATVLLDGTPSASFRYAPFGELIESAGSITHTRRFNDKQHDYVSDLAHYGFRLYDRVLLTWTQSDPLFRLVPEQSRHSPRRSNLYIFALNNALTYLDPDGRNPKDNGTAEHVNNPFWRDPFGIVSIVDSALEDDDDVDFFLFGSATVGIAWLSQTDNGPPLRSLQPLPVAMGARAGSSNDALAQDNVNNSSSGPPTLDPLLVNGPGKKTGKKTGKFKKLPPPPGADPSPRPEAVPPPLKPHVKIPWYKKIFRLPPKPKCMPEQGEDAIDGNFDGLHVWSLPKGATTHDEAAWMYEQNSKGEAPIEARRSF